MRKNASTLKGLNVNRGFVFNQIGKCYTNININLGAYTFIKDLGAKAPTTNI
jgi:hypothetical protein